MAEAQESLDVSDLKENFLECSVCLEHFDQLERRPRLLLNCLHSFCTQCLEQLLKKEGGGQVTCPNCRQLQKVKGTAQSLPIDPVRNKLVDYVQFKKGRKIPCTDCPDGSDAVARCHECQSYMCAPCKEAHHRNRVTRKHICQSLEEALNEPVRNFLSHYCEDHPDHKIEFFCGKCSSLCCISCFIVKHKGHDLDPIEDAANSMLSSLKTKIKDVEKSASVMSRKKSSLEEQNKMQEVNLKHTTDLINNKFDGLIGKLNGQRNKLITELKERTEITVNALKKQQEATEDSFAQMESTLEYFKQMESKSDDCEVLTAGPVLVQSLEAAAAMDQTQDGQGPPTWTFSSGAIDKTMSKVHKFGEIKSDTIDTKRHLRWLQEVKQSHGSVEVTALTQAGMINTKGLYRIGNLDNLETVSDLTLNKVIGLHVTQDISEENSARKYNYDQLVDLQSRLMLVAGQAEMGKENVDHFILVLDGVVRLAKTYIHLVSDGCVLFNCWKGKFLCEKERRACSFLEFGHGDNLEALKGHQDETEGVEKFILSLANQFEKFHEAWLKYVSEKRDKYLELNHFTIEQLVFLQKELIRLGSEDEPSLLVYPMLSLIKPNCSQADLTSAMQEAKDAVFAKEEENLVEIEDPEPVANDDPKQAFIDAMLDSNFSEKLARLALDANGPDDIDTGIVWCMEHQDEIQEDEEPSESMETTTSADKQFAGWQVGEDSVSSSAVSWVRAISSGNRSRIKVKDLMANLETVWTKFLDTVSSSVADYLSLEHLGIILRQLASTVMDTQTPAI